MGYLTSLRVENFRRYRKFSAALDQFNVLVGPNNSGKSSILDAIRLFGSALDLGRRRVPQPVRGPGGIGTTGYILPTSQLPITARNIHTNYQELDTVLTFRVSDGNQLIVYFTPDSACRVCFDPGDVAPKTTEEFSNMYPLEVIAVPVLAPFEEREALLTSKYFESAWGTRLSARLFRNYWWRHGELFKEFQELVEETWPGITILKPEWTDHEPRELVMFYKEGRIDREIYWAGFGFQVWLQMLTHVLTSRNDTVLVIDEPDIYLHPDLQRKLVSVLRGAGAQVVMATHSVEIINEVAIDEVLTVNPKNQSATRLTDLQGLQTAIDYVGSTQNVELARLSRGRKIVFFEGQDFRIVRRLAAVAGFERLSSALDLTIMGIGGISRHTRISDVAWTFKAILKTDIEIAAVFDRDFRSDEEIADFEKAAALISKNVHVLARKEIENYLLEVDAIAGAIQTRIKVRDSNSTAKPAEIRRWVVETLTKITDAKKDDIVAAMASSRFNFDRSKGKDVSTFLKECMTYVSKRWENLQDRLKIVPGKQVLAELNTAIQREYKVAVTMPLITNHMKKANVPSDLASLLKSLDEFSLPPKVTR